MASRGRSSRRSATRSREDLASFQRRARADLSAHLQNELQELVERYETLKSRRGRLDFLDLLARARDLLKATREVRRELQSSFTHIFVDEFQDTDPLQAEILLLLASADPEEDDWRQSDSRSGKALPRRRSRSNRSIDSGGPTSPCTSG